LNLHNFAAIKYSALVVILLRFMRCAMSRITPVAPHCSHQVIDFKDSRSSFAQARLTRDRFDFPIALSGWRGPENPLPRFIDVFARGIGVRFK
jgi:hypothetical protein